MSHDEPAEPVRQEPEGLHGRLVLEVIIGAVIVTLGCVLAVVLMLRTERRELGREYVPGYPAAPAIAGIEQTSIRGAPRGEARNARALAALDRYGWVDRKHGVATIPIGQAMAWLVRDAQDGKLEAPDPATVGDAGVPPGTRR